MNDRKQAARLKKYCRSDYSIIYAAAAAAALAFLAAKMLPRAAYFKLYFVRKMTNKKQTTKIKRPDNGSNKTRKRSCYIAFARAIASVMWTVFVVTIQDWDQS